MRQTDTQARPRLVTTPAQIGEIIRSSRKARGIPQLELATKLGVSQSRLSILESNPGGLTLDRLIALGSILGFELLLQPKAAATRPNVEW
jgi:HTH-type transcriptional regulator/antitoxin HipB